METRLHGIGVSPGIAIAPALVFDVDIYDVPQFKITHPEREWDRFQRAVAATRTDLEQLHQKTARELGSRHAEIFQAHLLLLDDPEIQEALRTRLFQNLDNVEYLLAQLATEYATMMARIEDAMLRERVMDLQDVVDRVLRHLVNLERPNLRDLREESIVVAHEMSPSDTANMNGRLTKGLAIDSGSATSHTAILARALEIPAVMGVEHLSSHVEPGQTMIVDGAEGLVILEPGPDTLAHYDAALERLTRKRAALRAAVKPGPVHTADNVEILTLANIALPQEVTPDLNASAQGIGLYRTEFLFLNRETLPSEEEQVNAYAEVVKAVAPGPVVLRTIDVGGDKFVSHLQSFREENPQLGWRAIRFSLARPDVFKVQLRAMVRASALGDVRIMFPMISGLEELRAAKKLLAEVCEDLAREGYDFNAHLPVGCMIEVPAAVMIAPQLAHECDFFSIGTNDLIQYSLAVDRVNEKIAYLYEPAHPAILRMIRNTAEAARIAGIPCAICGEMAGDPLYTEILLGLGIRELSMAPLALPTVRAVIAHTNLEEARELANELVEMPTVEAIKRRLAEQAHRRDAMDAHLPKTCQTANGGAHE